MNFHNVDAVDDHKDTLAASHASGECPKGAHRDYIDRDYIDSHQIWSLSAFTNCFISNAVIAWYM